jgi:hypothetical protein
MGQEVGSMNRVETRVQRIEQRTNTAWKKKQKGHENAQGRRKKKRKYQRDRQHEPNHPNR